ncbi:MAG: ABC transporter permease [Eubacterium sp.]
MKALLSLVNRNRKVFFNDWGMFFSSIITPLILLILYTTFLGNVYKSSFTSNLPAGLEISDKVINGCVGAQLFSSLLAVSCVTVACCVNLTMVQDKVTGSRKDLTISPIKPSTLALGYYISSVVNTLIIALIATAACLIYIGKIGWFMTFGDVIKVLIDVFLLSLFGTAISSIINCGLSTQGQMSAVGTIISCGYGFICGAYMPISQFGTGLQKILSYMPSTFGTSLLRNHAMRGVFEEMGNQGIPKEVIEGIKDSIDCNIYINGSQVATSTMLYVLLGTIAALIAIYVLINYISARKR